MNSRVELIFNEEGVSLKANIQEEVEFLIGAMSLLDSFCNKTGAPFNETLEIVSILKNETSPELKKLEETKFEIIKGGKK